MTGLVIDPDLYWTGVFLVAGLIGVTAYLWARVIMLVMRWKI